MKNTKIVALVATVALLVLGAAFTSFAAKYNWYQQDDEWRCKDKNGDDIYADWAKSGADWYWLNDEGYMTKEALVGDDTYYVDADGKRVSDKWEKIADEEGNDHWYYFQVGGKKLYSKTGVPKLVTVQGKKYIFNEEGHMMTGWVNVGDFDQPGEDEDWQAAMYYCGDEDDGAATFGWRQISVVDNAESIIDQDYWFYFLPSGKKFKATNDGTGNAYLAQKVINGKKYAFNEYGVMKAEWEQTENTVSSASDQAASYAWFKSVDDGSKLANGWFRVVPAEAFDPDTNADDTAKWFYAKGGKLYTSTIKTIAGKKYGFNDKGEMVTELNIVEAVFDETETDKLIGYTFTVVDNDPANANIAELDEDLGGKFVYYFSSDEDNDGSMKTGAQKVTVDGDDYDFYFSTKAGSKGQGITAKQGNKYYFNGKKVAANDEIADYLFYQYVKETAGAKAHVSIAAPKTFASFRGTNPVYDKKDATKVIGYRVPAVDAKSTYTTQYELISKAGAVAGSGTKKDGNGWKAVFTKDSTNGNYWLVSEE